MSRQLAFSSTISALVMTLFAVSATVRAEAAAFAPVSLAQSVASSR